MHIFWWPPPQSRYRTAPLPQRTHLYYFFVFMSSPNPFHVPWQPLTCYLSLWFLSFQECQFKYFKIITYTKINIFIFLKFFIFFYVFNFPFLKIFIFTLFYLTILYGFCHTLTWIHHGCTCDPKHEPPSHLPPYNIPLGHPRAPAPRCCILHQT